EVVDLVASQVDLPKEKIAALIERPKNAKMGDYAFPAFILAKTLHKNPAEIAKNIADNLSSDNFANIQAVGPYVNFAIDHEKLVSSTLKDVLTEKNITVIKRLVKEMCQLICLALTLLSQCQWATFVQL